MPQEPLPELMTTADRELFGLSRIERPKIKILLYTDSPVEVVDAPVGSFGLGRMISQLEGHAPAFADLYVKWVSRYPKGSTHADNKINVVLDRELNETKQPFDQIWFFGIHQVNKKKVDLRLGGGGPESELDAAEVKALRIWMDQGGGVLMTGDHANLRPNDALPPDPNPSCPYKHKNEPYAGLGRALGRCVPRAGELRDWDGPPTSREEDSNNTQVVNFGLFGDPFNDQSIFQSDDIAQQLILQTFDDMGNPVPGGKPHPLFFYKKDRAIQLFPDHLHEGEVVIPGAFDVNVWPEVAGIQPRPQVVAYGLDKRSGRRIQLLAAYDGHAAGVGRIVADSTWHHYFNVNLSLFPHPAPRNSAADQIGQFYGNLALWLSSGSTRFAMADAMFRWLAQDPIVLEELGPAPTANAADRLKAGIAARRLLLRVASPCEIHELLQMTIPEAYRFVEPFQTLYFPERGYNLSILPSKELLLGGIINRYPRELLEDTGQSLADRKMQKVVRAAFAAGADDAFNEQQNQVVQTARFALKFMAEARLRTSDLSARKESGFGVETSLDVRQPSERSLVMEVCSVPGWDMELVKPVSPPDSVRFFFREVEVTDGILKGVVLDARLGPISDLSGTCIPFGGESDPPSLSILSFRFMAPGSDGRPVGIFMAGFGFISPATGRGVFQGQYGTSTAFPVAVSSPPVDRKLLTPPAIDIGDTGTGNGTQT